MKEQIEQIFSCFEVVNYSEIMNGDMVMFDVLTTNVTDYEIRSLYKVCRRVDLRIVSIRDKAVLSFQCRPLI